MGATLVTWDKQYGIFGEMTGRKRNPSIGILKFRPYRKDVVNEGLAIVP